MKMNNKFKSIVIILLLFSTSNFILAQSGRGKARLKGEPGQYCVRTGSLRLPNG